MRNVSPDNCTNYELSTLEAMHVSAKLAAILS